MAAIEKPTFAYNSRTKHDRTENSTGISRFRVSEFKEIIFKIPRWRPSWIFKMAAIQKPNFAHNSKTKHDRKANSKATPRFLGLTNPTKLFSEFQNGRHLGFSR